MIYEIKSEELTVKINTLGAEMISVVDTKGNEYIYQPSDIWIGQAKNQFPNVAIAKDDYAIMKGEKHPIHQHGFLKIMELEATEISEKEISFSLKSNDATRVYYPYEFEFVIRFLIEGNQIKETYEVYNKDADTMYFGVSCHTGFNAGEGSYIDMGKNTSLIELLRPKQHNLMSGEEAAFTMEDGKVPVNVEYLGAGARILRNFEEKCITLNNPALHTAVELEFSDFPVLTLWSTADAKEFVCMMPWHALPDYFDTNHIFEEKKGNISLEAGKSFSLNQYFRFFSI
ncbi:MAG: hypothetical protein R3Y47_11825 [Lachnospiraceae bacterium]